MATYGFIIDNRKCIGCHACTVACKAEHEIPLGVNRTWVKYVEKGRYPNTRRLFAVHRCNHCAEAPCVEICPVEALFVRPDGIVDFDSQRCIGCKSCMQACPYDALYIDPETHTAAKCNYCAHRIDLGLEPACVVVCPEHAIIAGDLDDPNSEISQLLAREAVQVRKPEKGTLPKLWYIDGDTASLDPLAAPPGADYVWSAQARGVGHFAPQAGRPQNGQDTSRWVQELAVLPAGWAEAERKVAKEVRHQEEDPLLRMQRSVYGQEHIRRAYDAPRKGVLWGWEVSAYVWTKAIAAGAFLVPLLLQDLGLVRLSAMAEWALGIVALLFLALTGLLLIKDLDRPDRFLYVLLRPQKRSWLVRGGYLITFYGALLSLWMGARWLNLAALEEAARLLSYPTAVGVAIYTAFLFAQAKGRDFWQSPLLVPHMFVHALVAGGSVGLAVAALEGLEGRVFAWVSLGSGLLALLVMAAELLVPHPTRDAHLVVSMITGGYYRRLFWNAVWIGHVLPILGLLLGLWLGWPAWALALFGLALLAALLPIEHLWVRAPQLIPLA
ncbi:MAG: polysulfide reductase NrfD [Bacteroidetes bacterium]|nr:polysulfide reductase NrfD [Bacteroidota bacterium]